MYSQFSLYVMSYTIFHQPALAGMAYKREQLADKDQEISKAGPKSTKRFLLTEMSTVVVDTSLSW